MDIIIFIAFILFLAAIQWAAYVRGRNILKDWADGNDYEIIGSEFRWFRRGPFFWSSKGQMVYYVTVKLPDGSTRCAWVRVGSFWLGILSNKAEVRWDD